MRLSLNRVSAWCENLLWHLSDLRNRQPRVVASLVVLSLALFAVVPLLVLTLGGGDSPQYAVSEAPSREHSTEGDATRPVRYVVYNGLAQSQSDEHKNFARASG